MAPRSPRDRRMLVDARGREKALRPLAEADRRAALAAALEAYDRGDFFLAHELLEPAWMGTDEPSERELYGGLIKLAAAFVHAARGNPAGVAKNLRGARDRLDRSARSGNAGRRADLDPAAIVAAIDERLVEPDLLPREVNAIAVTRLRTG